MFPPSLCLWGWNLLLLHLLHLELVYLGGRAHEAPAVFMPMPISMNPVMAPEGLEPAAARPSARVWT